MKSGTTEEFIKKARKVHGDRYDYSRVDYFNSKTKVCIICPKHGEFWQLPYAHLMGQGCPMCGRERSVSVRTSNTNEFMAKAREVHGDKYDYSRVEYISNSTKVAIVCPKHGEFWQMPSNHLSGQGCPMCGNERISSIKASNTAEFVDKARKVHGDKYDYSKVEYVRCMEKIHIICPKHGEFWQLPYAHLMGQGCPRCGKEKRDSTNASNTWDFIERVRRIHGNKYDYSKIEYVNNKTKVCIVCPKHGEFWQTPNAHLNGQGCPKCCNERIASIKVSNSEEFIKRARKTHGDKYDYSKVEYLNSKAKVCIICNRHGEFWQEAESHLRGCGCPKCSNNMSRAEDEIIELLRSLNPQQRDREMLDGKELDIYIPTIKLGIEYNGLHWHSEEFGKGRHYHLDKLNDCNERGMRLIQIFEDEWVNHREICESKLMQICGLNSNPKAYGRKCLVREIHNTDAKVFLSKNHIQGFARATVYLGCFHDDKLIGVMSFKREKEGYWELNRFATDISYQCVGVGGKLFKHFTQNYDFQEIKSFADRRWTTDPKENLYTKLGFELAEFANPDYRYYKDGDMERHHKFGFRKQILHKKYGLPLTMTESQMVKELGFTRIWDCGLIKYTYKKDGI